MDKKQGRSSIKQTFGIKDDNTTVEAEVRLKRRISFSGKKLVREFSGEEETKTWKDSYEVSDHADGSLGINAPNRSTENIRSASAVGEQKHTARPIPSDDKENINYHTYPQARSIKLPPSTSVPATATSSLLCNTTEFIDQAQPQQSSTLQLDYSVDISLLEQEGRVKNTKSRVSTLSELYEPRSFSLDDNEAIRWPTQFERTIDFVQELRKSKQVDKMSLHTEFDKSATIEQEMGEFYKKTIMPVEHHEVPMDITMQCGDIAMTAPLETGNFENQQSRTLLLNEDMLSDASGIYNKSTQLRTNNFSNQQRMTMFLNEDVKTDAADTHSTLIVSKCENLNQVQKRQTVVFDDNDANGDMDICAKALLSKQSDTPVQLTQKLPEKNISSKATTAGSKVVVVRKICTPNAHKNDAIVGGVDQNRLKRYKQKQEEQRDVPRAVSSVNNHGNEQKLIVAEVKQKNSTFNFSLSNSHLTLLSPELSSPLFSPQYLTVVGKRDLNLRQLCDAIDQGKIQIYPDMPKTPLSARKGKRAVFSTFPGTKAIEHIESEERVTAMQLFNEALEVSANDGAQAAASKSEKGRTTTNSNHLDSTVTASTSCKRVLEFFEEDEMLLDSTSFLAKAKLGDETASRNSSKSSTLNRRETIHFHSEIDLDAVADGMHATEQANDTSLKQNGKTSDFLETTKQSLRDDEIMLSQDEHLLSKRTENEDEIKTSKSNKTTAFLESDKQMFASCDTVLSKTLYTGENMNLGTNCFPTRDEDKNIDTLQQYSARRQTLHLCEDIPLDMDTSQTIDSHLRHCEMADGSKIRNGNLANSPTESLNSKSQKYRQTLHFTNDNSILPEESSPGTSSNVQYSLNPDGCKNHVITITDITLGDMELEQDPKLNDSLEIKLKELRLRSIGKMRSSSIDIDPLASPMASSNTEVRERARKLFEGTPHRSFIEFEYLEREADLEQQQFEENTTIKPKVVAAAHNQLRRKSNYECSDIVLDVSGLKPLIDNDSQIHMSPVITALTKKRLTVNLTPNLPFPKKRQTLLFQNCNMDESLLCKSATRSLNTRLFKRRTAYGGTMSLDKHAVACERAVSDPESSAKPKTKTDTNGTNEVLMECESKTANVGTELSNRNTQEHEKEPKKETQIVDTKVSPGHSRIPVLKRNDLIVGTLQSPKPLDESELNHSLETIQVPRRVNTFVHEYKKNTLLLLPSDAANQSVEEQKQQQQSIEDNPITISDVSVYYLAQRQSVQSNSDMQKPAVVEQTLNTTESIRILSDVDEEPELQQQHVVPEYRTSDDCYNKVDKFQKCFINLTCNSETEIDQTRLTLVETLLDDNEFELPIGGDDDVDDDVNDDVDDDVDENNQHQHAVQEHCVNNIGKPLVEPNDGITTGTSLRNPSICRRCRGRQKMLLNDSTFSTTDDSFMLPPVPAMPSVNMERLRQLHKRPRLQDVHEYYRRLSLERSFDLESPLRDDDANLETEAEKEDEIDVLAKKLEDNLDSLEKQLISDALRTPVIVRKSFVQRLEALLNAQTQSWIFNYQKQIGQCLFFDHKKIIIFCLVVKYKELTDMGEVIEVQTIQIRNSRVPQKNWKPIDYVMDFQLKLELPFNLETLCTGSDEHAVCNMLCKIDEVCLRVRQLAFSLWALVCSEQASLIRIGNCIFVQKYVRTIISPEDEYARVEKLEFRIEVTNLKKIYCKDIASPPLHKFREDVQFLPVGLDFLRVFLANPMKYLK